MYVDHKHQKKILRYGKKIEQKRNKFFYDKKICVFCNFIRKKEVWFLQIFLKNHEKSCIMLIKFNTIVKNQTKYAIGKYFLQSLFAMMAKELNQFQPFVKTSQIVLHT